MYRFSYSKETDGTYFQFRGQCCRGNEKQGEQDKLPIGTIYSKNPPHGYPFPPPHFKEGGSSTYPKLMEMGAKGLKILGRKEGIKAK